MSQDRKKSQEKAQVTLFENMGIDLALYSDEELAVR